MSENSMLDDLLHEDRKFDPSAKFRANSIIKDKSLYERAAQNSDEYWASVAEQLDWYKKWDTVKIWNPPFAQWFVGGSLNACYNCVDRHIEQNRGNRVAFLWDGEGGDHRRITYQQVYDEVNRLASAYKKLGVTRGDRVAIYMPMIPEGIYAMLACARIGAIHTVIFGGFSVASLEERINDAQACLVVTADGAPRRGRLIPLKEIVDRSLAKCPTVDNVIVVQHAKNDIEMVSDRDWWYHDLLIKADKYCEPEKMDSEDILFILYTSGTTGKPKGIVHTTGGYMANVAHTTKIVFDLREDDRFWCTADIGWITGHSYLVYGPMANCATQVIYQGTPDYPQHDQMWRIIERYKVTILYTAPTAIRVFMRWGSKWVDNCNISSLRLLGSVGEPINPEAWMWYHTYIGKTQCPIVDTWWQTETGAIMISPLPSITPTKPGSATFPLPGIAACVKNEKGDVITGDGGGYLAITEPWPSMLRGIWGDEQRFRDTYWSKWDGVYFPGDGAKVDADSYFWLLGRVDDIMIIAGHNISTMEVESALVDHHTVAEAAVVGVHDDIKGSAIVAFVILRGDFDPSEEGEETLKQHVTEKIGPIARPRNIIFTLDVPKTRSGKIMRRLLRDIAEGRTPGDVTTLADPSVLEKLKAQYEEA